MRNPSALTAREKRGDDWSRDRVAGGVGEGWRGKW